MSHRKEAVLIVDYGSPSTQLLARRLRALQVYCEIVPCTASAETVMAFAPKALVLSGGAASVETQRAKLDPSVLMGLEIPILAVGNAFNELLGLAEGSRAGEPGAVLELRSDAVLGLGAAGAAKASGAPWPRTAPGGFQAIAHWAEPSTPAAFADEERGIYGLAFHPEHPATEGGDEILRAFLRRAAVEPNWTMEAFAEQATQAIREQVGTGRVICGLSGGVDSSVTALLIHRAIGDQLQCIFVDNGLLRKGERDEVRALFEDHFKVPLRVVDAEARFLEKLAGVTDPEAKRKIIGHEFIAVFDEAARSIEDARFLAQGTVYADIVESVNLSGGVIKSHHNVGGLPEHMKLELVEPLRQLFKDEVRQLGRVLGLPESMVERHPFPGPGLAIRCLGELNKSRLETLRDADAIAREELAAAGLQRKIWQAFVVLLPIRTVGVVDHQRTYEETAVLRAVGSEDGMTAQWSRIPFDVLERISSRITAEVPGINRVVYDISSKPPATIEWE